MTLLVARSGQGCQAKTFARDDQGGSRLSITVGEGPWGGSLQETQHNLICLRRSIQVGACKLS